MSFKALAWAVDQKPERPADKLVLMGLADRHNTEEHIARPSIAWLVDFSGFNRKTVIISLGRLEAAGYIADSGLRYGRTSQVKAYSLTLDGTVANKEQSRKGDAFETVPKHARKQSRFRDTEPIKEPITSEANASSVVRVKGHPIDDFVPVLTPEGKAVADRHTPEWAEVQLQQFKDYYRSRGKRLKDYNAGFRNWMLNAERFEERDNGKRTGNADEPATPLARAALARAGQRRNGHPETPLGRDASGGPRGARSVAGAGRPF